MAVLLPFVSENLEWPQNQGCVLVPSLDPLFAVVFFENGPFLGRDLVNINDRSQGDTYQQMGQH